VAPGTFQFHIRAEKGKAADTMTLEVIVPEAPRYSFDSLYIDSGSLLPRKALSVRTGDQIDLGQRYPHCNAFCIVLPPTNFHAGAATRTF
jgi:hypothetical protein